MSSLLDLILEILFNFAGPYPSNSKYDEKPENSIRRKIITVLGIIIWLTVIVGIVYIGYRFFK